jgi:hypothetical protein
VSTRVILGGAGAIVGGIIGGPQGAAWGWAIGSSVGNVVDPQVIKGPSLGDLAQQTSQEGGPIPIIFGMSPPISGNVIATSQPRIVKKKSGGKGGPKVESEYAYRTYAIGVCEGPIGGFLRVWRNGKKVYDALDPNFTEGSLSGTLASRNEKFLEKARFFLGTYDQNASPDLEAVFGAGTTPSYRGLAYMVMADEDVTDMRGVIPQWTFQVSATSPTVREVYAQFLSSGTYEPHENVPAVDVLLLGGGGGGGAPGAGGGGAGGLAITTNVPVSGPVSVTVGAGGAGGTSGGTNYGSNGGDSTFPGATTAQGGGGGAGPNSTGPSVGQGNSGGCGGGGSRRLTNGNSPGGLGGSGTQGFAGGQGWQSEACANSGYGGGGGGLGGVGQGGTNAGDKAGGPGITLASTGFGAAFMAPHNIGGGGGGGSCNGGSGGFGGGGRGGNRTGGNVAAGSDNTGGGGGGNVNTARPGGSGLALVRERHVDNFRYTDVNPNVKAFLRVFDTIEDLTGNAAITRTGPALGNFITAARRIITPTSFFNNGTANNARYVTIHGAPDDFVFSGEFCVEGHFYYPAVVSSSEENTLFTIGGFTNGYSDVGVTGLLRVVQDAGDQRLRLISGSGTTLYTGSAGSFTAGATHHVALLRINISGTLTLQLYIDGSQVYSAPNTNTFGNTFVSGLSTIYIGRGSSSIFHRDWTGCWNRFKVTNGEPVYTSDFTPPTTFNSSGSDDVMGLPLTQAVADICSRAGLESENIDTSQLPAVQLLGIPVTNEYPAAQALLALGQIYRFDISKYDGKIRFIPRGGNSVATITEDDMVDDDEDLEESKRTDAIQIPRVVHLSYHDADTDALTPIKQSSQERVGDRRAIAGVSLQSAVVMDANTAARAADIAHKVMIEDQKGEVRFALSDQFIRLVPSNPIIVQWQGKSERLRIHQVDILDGFQRYICLRDRQSAYTSEVEGIPPPVVPTPPSNVVGPTVVVPLDIPLLRDSDDNAGLGYYVAISGLTDAWAGATVELSYDGGANYIESREGLYQAVIGVLTSALPDHPADYPDGTNEFTVQLYPSGAELLDSTLAGMLNRENLAAIGSPEDGWELINFADVAESDPETQEWTVSNLLRGRKGTQTKSHPAGAQFVLLDRNVLAFEPASVTDIGRTLTFRATSLGEATDTGTVVSMVYAGRCQIERKPAYLQVERDGNDLKVSFQGVGRLGGGATAIHGSFFTGYRVTFDDGADQIVVNTVEQSVTQDVSALSSPVTVRVQQINSLTGAGPSIEVIV